MKSRWTSTLGMAVALGACGDLHSQEASENPAVSTDLGAIEEDLVLGMSGPDVRAVHGYLTRYGYFPNAQHTEAYPAWRPVAARPETDGVFDENTEVAVRALQRNSGLDETGVVDEATRHIISGARCGVPDNVAEIDPSSKFDKSIQPFGGLRLLTYKVENGDTEVTQAQVKSAAAAAANSWYLRSSFNLQHVAGTATPNITIRFEPISSPTTLADYAPSLALLRVDSNELWSVTNPVSPTTATDLESVLLHELGHALGLGHSSIAGAVMSPYLSPNSLVRTPSADDSTAVSIWGDVYTNVPGITARDLATAELAGGASQTWAASTANELYRFDGASWVKDTSKTAMSVAVDPNGCPWVIDTANRVWRKSANSTVSGSWTELTGRWARDIGIGKNGAVWIVSTDGVAPNNPVYALSGSTWVAGGGNANRIAVGPNGIPWTVDGSGVVRRRTSATPTSGSFTTLPVANTAKDITVNSAGHAWIIGTCANSNCPIYVFAEQPQTYYPSGQVSAAGRAEWVAAGTTASRAIAAGNQVGAWVVDSAGAVLRPVR